MYLSMSKMLKIDQIKGCNANVKDVEDGKRTYTHVFDIFDASTYIIWYGWKALSLSFHIYLFKTM